MKTIAKILLFVCSVFFILQLIGCGSREHSNPLDPEFSGTRDTIIPSTTKAIDSTTFTNQLVSISSDSSTFVFNQGSAIDELKVNDILVTDKGMGLLRKVNQVSKSNGLISIQTNQTVITEAIQKGTASFTVTLSPSDTLRTLHSATGVLLKTSSENSTGFFFRLTELEIWDNVVANGTIDITPTVKFDITIDDWELKHLEFSTTISEDLDLRIRMNLLATEISRKKEIYRAYLNPIVTFIGFVPVVITPVMTIDVGVDAKVYVAVSTGVRQHANFTAGLMYENNQWSPIVNLNNSFDFEPPNVTAGAKLKGSVGPQWNYLMYGLVGPYTEISLFGELSADITRNPWASFYAGIQVGGGVRLEILSHQITDYNKPDIIGLRTKLWESTNAPSGKIIGVVRDAATSAPLSEVSTNVFMTTTLIATSLSQIDGRYEINVPEDAGYRVVFSKQGYLDSEYQNVNVAVGSNTILEPVLQIDQSYSGNGIISGTIKNALDGTGVSNVILELRKGINVTTGNIISTTSTNSSGNYTFNSVSAGNYTIEATKSNFNSTYFTVISLGGQTVSNQDAAISPILVEGETRIVLTWGAAPRDLDSHLTGPLSDGSRFHMYYTYSDRNNGSPWPEIVRLDLDDTSGYGPETTTLLQQIDGIYRFSVHDFSNRGSTNSFALSNSSALVRVYQNSGLVASFSVPPNTGGTLWTVFEMSGNILTPINQVSYESAFSTQQVNKDGYITPDIEIFRNLPDK